MKTGGTFKADIYLNKNKTFWESLETICVSECCGIDAYDFSTENINSALPLHDKTDLSKNLIALAFAFEKSGKNKISSYLLNAYLKKEDFYSLLNRIIKNITHEN